MAEIYFRYRVVFARSGKRRPRNIVNGKKEIIKSAFARILEGERENVNIHLYAEFGFLKIYAGIGKRGRRYSNLNSRTKHNTFSRVLLPQLPPSFIMCIDSTEKRISFCFALCILPYILSVLLYARRMETSRLDYAKKKRIVVIQFPHNEEILING